MKKVLLLLLVLFILAQFFRPACNAGAALAATDITHVVPVPDSIMAILRKSCYDCHSNHTDYPWYNNISPVSWWLANHVKSGKRALNFTEFSTYTYRRKAHRLDDIAETVEKHEMPLSSYLWIHTDAELNDAQRQALISWSKAASQRVMQDSLSEKGNK